jgi:hypothetical protein
MKFSITTRKKCPYNSCDCLIEVTAWICLNVVHHINYLSTNVLSTFLGDQDLQMGQRTLQVFRMIGYSNYSSCNMVVL